MSGNEAGVAVTKTQILRFGKTCLIAIAIGLTGLVVYYPYSPRAVQDRNMAKARDHIPVVQRALGADPRFSKVQLLEYTAKGGSLGVFGSVQTSADLNRLTEIVAATSPPTAVAIRVRVEDDAEVAQKAPSP